MKRLFARSLAATAGTLVLLLSGSIPTPTEAQSIPRPSSCSLSLTGAQAWLQGSLHQCGAVEVATRYRGQRLCFPYPGGQFCVTVYRFEMQARRRPTGGSVLVAKVDVPNVPACSFNVGNAWSTWRDCGGSGDPPAPPSMTLTSVVLFYF